MATSDGVQVSRADASTTPRTDAVDARTCPECDGQIVQDGDERVCTECGLVVDEDRVDHGPEWRGFDLDEWHAKARTSGSIDPALHDYGRGTTMGPEPDDVSAERAYQLRRMRTWQSRSRWSSKADKNLSEGLGEVKRMACALDVTSDRRDQACRLFRSASAENMLQGRSIESMSAASVYAVARIHGTPLTLDDVVAVARVGRGAITTAYDVLNRELGLPAAPRDPTLFVPRLASEFGLTDDQRRTAADLAGECDAATSGCKPAGIAAAAVYLAAGGVISQAAASDAAGVSEATLRNRLADLPGGGARGD